MERIQRGTEFVIRLVRKGRVSINGRTFQPSEHHQQYDGRLDGMYFAFGLYYSGHDMQPYISLWGTAAAYYLSNPRVELPEPHCVDGTYPWLWWRTVDDKEANPHA